MNTVKTHPFHIVEPSAWPLLSALAALATVIGLILFMHGQHWHVLAAGSAFLIFTAIMWWRDVVNESLRQGLHTDAVHLGFRYGMVLFIASEVAFFGAFFWAFFHAALDPLEATGGVWPPKGIKPFDPFEIPYLNTLILLLSGTTVTWAHHALIEGRVKEMIRLTGITILLGMLFTSFQAFEYIHAPFAFKDGIYPSTFYLATGFHGVHVIIGTIFLIVCFFRARKGHFTPTDHFGFEAAAWYWHFVDVVWLFLFISVYWWGGS